MKVYAVIKNREDRDSEYYSYCWNIEEIYLSRDLADEAVKEKTQKLEKDRENFQKKYKGQLDVYHSIIKEYYLTMSMSQRTEYITEYNKCNWKYDIEYEVEEYEVKS